MGVDKENVGLVIHWNISNSIENYIQESGRAGRKENIDADCYILYNDDDLNKHFSLLRHSMLTFYDIQQIWKTIKQKKEIFSSSISDLAKEAGWSEQNVYEQETKVKIAISVLERAGYIKRLPNVVHIYATSINVKNMVDADKIIVLNDGKIDGIGTSEELLKTNQIYKEVYESQMKGDDNNG